MTFRSWFPSKVVKRLKRLTEFRLGLELCGLDLSEPDCFEDSSVSALGRRPVSHSVPPSLCKLVGEILFVTEIDVAVVDLQRAFGYDRACLCRVVRRLHSNFCAYLLLLSLLNVRWGLSLVL